MIVTDTKKIFNKTNLISTIRIILICVILLLVGHISTMGHDIYRYAQETKKDEICPALLSISRSARDSLIVMKAEPLCNKFVLETLK